MAPQNENPQFIHITETVLRLYVLLAQYLDRCHDQAVQEAFPESEFQAHLQDARSQATELLATNRIVKGKVEGECERILKLGGEGSQDQLNQEREVLRIKTLVLSDLLAVFRSV